MKCKNCNAPLKEGCKFCTNCGTLAEVTSATDTTLSETSNTQVSTPAESPECKVKKSNKIAIKAMIIAAILCCTTFVVFAFTPVGNFVKSLFMSSEAEYKSIEINALNENLDMANDILNSIKTPATKGSGNLKISLSDDLFDTLNSFGITDDITQYIGDVRTVGMDFDYKTDNSLTGTSLKFKLEDTEIASTDIIIDTENQKLYMSYPDLIDGALETDLGYSNYPVNLPSYEAIEKLTISDKFTDGFVDIVNVALDEIDDVEKERATLSIDGVEQSCTKYSINYDANLVESVLKTALKETQKNDTIKEEIISFVDIIEEITNEDIELTESDIEYALDEAIDNLSIPEDVEFTYNLYADSKNNILGRELKVEEGVIKMLTAKNGKDYAFEYSIEEDDYTIASYIGKGEVSNDKFTGDVALKINEKDFIKASLTDYYSDIKNMEMSGNMVLSAGKGFTDNLYVSSSVESIINKVEFEIAFNSSKSSSSINMDVKFGGLNLGSIAIESNNKSDFNLTIPEETFDEYEFANRLNNINMGLIIDRLREAGIPSSVLDMLTLMTGSSQATPSDASTDFTAMPSDEYSTEW